MNKKKGTIRTVLVTAVFPVAGGVIAGLLIALFSFAVRIDYPGLIRSGLNSLIGFHVTYDRASFVLLPVPGFQIEKVHIYRSFVDRKPIAVAGKLVFSLSWRSILARSIVLNRIGVHRAEVSLTRSEDGRIAGLSRKKEESGSNLESTILLSLMQIGGVVVHDSRLTIKDEATGGIENFNVDYLSLLYRPEDRSLRFDGRGRVNGDALEWEMAARLPEKYGGFQSLDIRGRCEFRRFSSHLFQGILNRFYLADYTGARVSGFFTFIKKPEDPFIGEARITMAGLALKRGVHFSPFTADFSYRFSNEGSFFQLPRISITWPDVAYLYGNGWLNWTHALNMHFNINATEGNYQSVIDLIQVLRRKTRPPRPGEKIPGRRTFHLDLKRILAFNHNYDTVVGDMVYENWILQLKDFELGIYGGSITGGGSIDYVNKTFSVKAQADHLRVEKLIGPNSITGDLNASMRMFTSIVSKPDFYSRMRASGVLDIRKGELLGYANVMRPVAMLGKVLNVTGPSGKSTEFTRITTRYVIRDGSVYISGLDMTGVGLDAKASGRIGFDKSIDMNVTLGIGGDLWKHVLKIPIIYNGTINQDYPHVDPIWVAAVTVGGAMIIVPPWQPIQGVILGSLASDYIRDAYEGVKSWFSDDDEVQLKRELEKEFQDAPEIKDPSSESVQ